MFRNLICLLLSYALVFQASFALEVNGELKNAVGEKLSSDPVTGLVEGRIYYNTTTKTLRVYDGTAWKNKVDTNSTQTITNKTINGNNNTLNVLAPTQLEGFVPIANGGTGQSTKQAAYDALSPNGSQGDLTYRGVSNNVALPVGANGQVLTVAGGYPSWADSTGGAGSGEKNYVTNPSAATNISGWTCVGDLAVVRTTTAADLPRENTTPSGIKITATAGTQSTADYCYFNFTLDDIDLNRKLNVKFATKQTGSYVSNDLAVVITTQADRTTAVATPVVTNIAAADYDFNGNGFDTASTTTLSLVIRATADMATSAGITISDVVVGPGTIITVPPVGVWQSWTPTFAGLGTVTGVQASYQRVGPTLYGVVNFTTGTPTAALASITMPLGLTNNSLITANTSQVGTWNRNNSTAANVKTGLIITDTASSNLLYFSYNDTAAAASPLTRQNGNNIFGTAQYVTLYFELPVNEWAGSQNYAGQNDIIYASNSAMGNADATTATTVLGPQGTALPSVTYTGLRDKSILLPVQIQEGSSVKLQVKYSSTSGWIDLQTASIGSAALTHIYTVQNGTSYGVGIVSASTGGVVVVRFGQYAFATSTYGAVGTNWDATTGTAFYRVVYSPPGAAVGFGLADTSSSGLISTGTQSFAGSKTFTGDISTNGTMFQTNSGLVREKRGGSATITNTGTIVISAPDQYWGLIQVRCKAESDNSFATLTSYQVSRLFTSFSATSYATVNGPGGGRSFTVTGGSGNITITNTSGGNSICGYSLEISSH